MSKADNQIIVPPKKELVKSTLSSYVGWHKNIPNDEYHGGPGTSSTQVKTMIEQTGAHFDYNKKNHVNKDTDTKALGTCFHTLTLEPEMFDKDIAVRPAAIKQRRGKDWEAFKLDAGDRAIVTEDQYLAAKTMAHNVREHPFAGPLVRDIVKESSIYWWYKNPRAYDDEDTTHYKELLKVRPDALSLSHPLVVDLKSTVDGSFTGFMKQIMNYYYHVSGAMYMDGANQCEELLREMGHHAFVAFIFVVCENFPPYEVSVYKLSDMDRQRGSELYHRSIRKLHEARELDWPGYNHREDFGIRDTELPPWSDRGHYV